MGSSYSHRRKEAIVLASVKSFLAFLKVQIREAAVFTSACITPQNLPQVQTAGAPTRCFHYEQRRLPSPTVNFETGGGGNNGGRV